MLRKKSNSESVNAVSESSTSQRSPLVPGWRLFLKDYICFYVFVAGMLIGMEYIFHHRPIKAWPALLLLLVPWFAAIFYLLFHVLFRALKSPLSYFAVSATIACFWWWIFNGKIRSPDYSHSNVFGSTYVNGKMTLLGWVESLFSIPVFNAAFAFLLLAIHIWTQARKSSQEKTSKES